MGELATYSLSDFILFSGSTYYRLFEIYNQDVWPLQLVSLLFAAVIIHVLLKSPAWGGRVVTLLLGICWLWVAWAYLYQRFYQIHVVANWYALAFVIQAGLMAWFGLVRNRFAEITDNRMSFYLGWVFLLAGLFVYPFIALFSGRFWLQSEMFGLAPDPTVVVTLGLLMIFKSPALLYLVPLAWLLVSYTTLVFM